MDDKQIKEWHLDRKVTLGLIAALLLNACGSVWWAAKLDTTVSQHEQKISTMASALNQLSIQQSSVNENLARIQEGQKYQSDMLREVRDQLARQKEK